MAALFLHNGFNREFLIDYVKDILNTIYFLKFEISLYKISLQTTKLIIKM